MLNKQKGNMFNFVTHTWNPIKGKCQHGCSYCYMNKMYKRYKWNEEIRLDEKCLKDNLGSGNTIFLGSSTDMFEKHILDEWIAEILIYCSRFDNAYLFQSKNPYRFRSDEFFFPEKTIFGTTIETNRNFLDTSFVPSVYERMMAMQLLKEKKMLTIEPIMAFDLEDMCEIIKKISPFQVNIGADSGHNNLPEPSKEKTLELISELKKITTVHIKDTLKRIIK